MNKKAKILILTVVLLTLQATSLWFFTQECGLFCFTRQLNGELNRMGDLYTQPKIINSRRRLDKIVKVFESKTGDVYFCFNGDLIDGKPVATKKWSKSLSYLANKDMKIKTHYAASGSYGLKESNNTIMAKISSEVLHLKYPKNRTDHGAIITNILLTDYSSDCTITTNISLETIILPKERVAVYTNKNVGIDDLAFAVMGYEYVFQSESNAALNFSRPIYGNYSFYIKMDQDHYGYFQLNAATVIEVDWKINYEKLGKFALQPIYFIADIVMLPFHLVSWLIIWGIFSLLF